MNERGNKMVFTLKSCIVWQDEHGSTYCIKKYEKENGAFYCTQEVIKDVFNVDECKKMAPSGVVYKNKEVYAKWGLNQYIILTSC